MVLDLTSGRLSDAIVHAQKASESVDARLAELRDGLAGQLKPESRGQSVGLPQSAKGKGKAVGGKLVRDDLVQNMTKPQIEGELKELEGLKEDLAMKVRPSIYCSVNNCSFFPLQVEELKTSPNEPSVSAPALAAQSLDKELNGAASGSAAAPVNDLTSMVVKKKKKAPDAPTGGKRKADGDVGSPSEKKAKLEEPAQS